ncbi:hypothetical protein GCM10009806_09890 [Microbacterium flavum]
MGAQLQAFAERDGERVGRDAEREEEQGPGGHDGSRSEKDAEMGRRHGPWGHGAQAGRAAPSNARAVSSLEGGIPAVQAECPDCQDFGYP